MKIISSKFAMFAFSYASLFFLGFSILGFAEMLYSTDEKVVWFLIFLLCGTIGIFMLWSLNRAACIIWIEDGIVKRKGLICGFYKECSVKSIKKVVVRYSHKEGDFIYLVDNSKYKFYPSRKDSYIAFRKTKKNFEFLQSFWTKNIEK